jgi:hypothetical protein
VILLAALLWMQPAPPPGVWPCDSPLEVHDIGGGRASVECHRNPSLNHYYEVDLRTGRVLRELKGYAFTRSPDGKRVAHAGWVPHFSPAPIKSFYLQVDGRALYPRDAGPEERGLKIENGVHRDVHDLMSNLAWSPDGRAVAYLVRAYDWRPDPPGSAYGDELHERCLLVVVPLYGEARVYAARRGQGRARLSWDGTTAVDADWDDGRVRVSLK